MVIYKNWKALIGMALQSWILARGPVLALAISIANTSYRFDGKDTLTYCHRIINKRENNFDLRRMKSTSASDSPLTGGRLIISNNDGNNHVFRYVKNARMVAEQLRVAVDESSRACGDVQNRIIA